MNEVLLDAFRHNSWATQQLLSACHVLSEEQLASPAPGSFGSVLDTFNHIILSDAGYLRRLSGHALPWAVDRDRSTHLGQLAARVAETEALWERFLAEPIDAERLLLLDERSYEARAGVLIAQALHHGNAHREQICAILTRFGLEPPNIQPWGYAEATGRGRERPAPP